MFQFLLLYFVLSIVPLYRHFLRSNFVQSSNGLKNLICAAPKHCSSLLLSTHVSLLYLTSAFAVMLCILTFVSFDFLRTFLYIFPLILLYIFNLNSTCFLYSEILSPRRENCYLFNDFSFYHISSLWISFPHAPWILFFRWIFSNYISCQYYFIYVLPSVIRLLEYMVMCIKNCFIVPLFFNWMPFVSRVSSFHSSITLLTYKQYFACIYGHACDLSSDFHIPSSNGSARIAVKLKAKWTYLHRRHVTVLHYRSLKLT
jgi:hypothetical protein